MKVLICDPVDEGAIQKMRDGNLDVDVKTGMTPDELIRTIPDYEAIVVRSATKATAPAIEAGKKLKVIVRGGVGTDNIDKVAAKANGVDVRNTPSASSASVAELALGMMFSLARNLHYADGSTKAGKWEKKALKGEELSGKTLGIIGIGRIGRQLADRATAIGMKVIAYDLFTPHVAASFKMTNLNKLLAESDYISLHIPLTDKTKHLINEDTIGKMKKGVRIVNCARGGTVDENALAEAIKSGRVKGAGIDVYETEPAKTNPLFGLKEVVCTPHIGASTGEGQARVGLEVADILMEYK